MTPLGLLEDLYITVRRGAYDQLESTMNIPSILAAPVSAGQPLAEIAVKLGDKTLLTAPLRALEDISLWFE